MAPAMISNVCRLRTNRIYAVRRNNLVLNQTFNRTSVRSKASAATVGINGNQKVVFESSGQASHGPEAPKDPLDLSFSNTKEAYKSKATFELIRAWFVLKLSSYNFIIEHNAKVSDIEVIRRAN